MIETLATANKIIPYLDMPLQHINDRVLKRMIRRVDRVATEKLLHRLRSSIPDLALRTTKAGGRVILAGMPSRGADLAPVWFRELELLGAYATGTELTGNGPVSTFDLAMDLALEAPLDGMVGAQYPLSRWREALDHAFAAGRLGTVKIAFNPREE